SGCCMMIIAAAENERLAFALPGAAQVGNGSLRGGRNDIRHQHRGNDASKLRHGFLPVTLEPRRADRIKCAHVQRNVCEAGLDQWLSELSPDWGLHFSQSWRGSDGSPSPWRVRVRR